MIEKTCRCGKSKMNFKMDIGPFFVTDCCEAEGYDSNGNREMKTLDEETQKLLEEELDSSTQDNLTEVDNKDEDLEVEVELESKLPEKAPKAKKVKEKKNKK